MAACRDTRYVLDKLAWMRAQDIWPNGRRYLWADAFGVVLLVSFTSRRRSANISTRRNGSLLKSIACLGAPAGFASAKRPTAMASISITSPCGFMRSVLGRHLPDYRRKGVELVRQIHDRFVVPDRGVVWKMNEDLSAPYPGYGFGALDAFDGYVSYRLLDEKALSREIADMRLLIDRSAPDLHITQDLGLGMMLWMTQFFPDEDWARTQKARCLGMLDRMWVDEGYFCREPGLHQVKFAFTNYGVSVGLQAVNAMPERIRRLNAFFETYRSGDEYDREAITHVMACSSHFPGYLVRSFG